MCAVDLVLSYCFIGIMIADLVIVHTCIKQLSFKLAFVAPAAQCSPVAKTNVTCIDSANLGPSSSPCVPAANFTEAESMHAGLPILAFSLSLMFPAIYPSVLHPFAFLYSPSHCPPSSFSDDFPGTCPQSSSTYTLTLLAGSMTRDLP